MMLIEYYKFTQRCTPYGNQKSQENSEARRKEKALRFGGGIFLYYTSLSRVLPIVVHFILFIDKMNLRVVIPVAMPLAKGILLITVF
jgi:hypothetical protein